MLSLTKRLQALTPYLLHGPYQLRSARTVTSGGGHSRRRPKSPPLLLKEAEEWSEWWVIDGEMHEIGDHVPPRERFVIPRENIPNKRRKQLREQFMSRTRLVLKESEHDPWCRKYMELYNELRENWERLYWDEGYSKKLAQDHAKYESVEDDDEDFSPYRSRRSQMEYNKGILMPTLRQLRSPSLGDLEGTTSNWPGAFREIKDQNFGRNRQSDTWEKVSLIRDKFEYDRERRMREKAFAPMHGGTVHDIHDSNSWNQPLNADRYFSQTERLRGV